MNLRSCRPLGIVLLAASLLLAPLGANAGIVSSDQLLPAQGGADAERARIQAFLDRADAEAQLKARGVDAADAKVRISALSDEEVRELARRIDSLPAGGNIGNFTDTQIVIIVLLMILVAVIAS